MDSDNALEILGLAFRETIAGNARRSSVKRIFSAVTGEAG